MCIRDRIRRGWWFLPWMVFPLNHHKRAGGFPGLEINMAGDSKGCRESLPRGGRRCWKRLSLKPGSRGNMENSICLWFSSFFIYLRHQAGRESLPISKYLVVVNLKQNHKLSLNLLGGGNFGSWIASRTGMIKKFATPLLAWNRIAQGILILGLLVTGVALPVRPVSYTHLDVYKRQGEIVGMS